jgi:hypothetical protein
MASLVLTTLLRQARITQSGSFVVAAGLLSPLLTLTTCQDMSQIESVSCAFPATLNRGLPPPGAEGQHMIAVR